MKTNKTHINPDILTAKQITIRRVNGKIILEEYKPRQKKCSAAQRRNHKRFADAAKWAKRELADPSAAAFYARHANRKKKTPYLVALTDYLTAPRLNRIGTDSYRGEIGDVIEFDTQGDAMVTIVLVTIIGADGREVEYGAATMDEKRYGLWHYVATKDNKTPRGTVISGAAVNRPCNFTILDKTL